MGVTLNVKSGFGFAVPVAAVRAIEDAQGDNGMWGGFYDDLDQLIEDEPLLDYDMAAFYDYSPDDDDEEAYAVFVRSTLTNSYGAGVFRPDGKKSRIDAEEAAALLCVAEKLGIAEPDLEDLTVVSFG